MKIQKEAPPGWIDLEHTFSKKNEQHIRNSLAFHSLHSIAYKFKWKLSEINRFPRFCTSTPVQEFWKNVHHSVEMNIQIVS